MTNRRVIQQEHERAVVRDFLAWLNPRRGTQFKVVEEPIAPEAIIRSVRVTCWVEVTDAFWTDAYARDIFSHATPGEKHSSVEPGPYGEMDRVFAGRFITAVCKKLAKRSYMRFLRQYGPGYLLVSIQHPWFDSHTTCLMKALWKSRAARTDLGCFKEVYVAFWSRNRRAFQRWHV